MSLATLKLAAPEKGDEVHTHTHTHTHTNTHTNMHTHTPARAHTHTVPPSLLQVKVLSGADKDSVGSLLSVDEGDGVVRVKAIGEVKFFSLKNLAKFHKT